jgi:hypothetical protein
VDAVSSAVEERRMSALSSGLLRAGLELKLNQMKRATRSYVRDRTDQATGTLAGYAIAAGLFAACGIFLIAATLVGLDALFRWIEINYGLFWAFGAIGLLLLLIAGICAGLAMSRLRRPSPHFPSLTSRLRVAIKGKPRKPKPAAPDELETASDTATAILRAPAAPLAPAGFRTKTNVRPTRTNRELQAGLMLASATVLGWAAGRQVIRQTRRMPG